MDYNIFHYGNNTWRNNNNCLRGSAKGLIILILFAPFYFFCFLIKNSVDEWIREYNFHQQLIEQRKESKENKIEGRL